MWEITFIHLGTGQLITDTVEAPTTDDAMNQLKAIHGDRISFQHGRPVCSCHHEQLASHELCCGHDQGRNPNCPIHGDGSYVG